MMARSVIIDTDIAFGSPDADVDDALAVLSAFSLGLEVKALTAVGGNVSADKASRNLDRLLARIGKSDVPHSYSCSEPMDPSRWVHGRWNMSKEQFVSGSLFPGKLSSVELMRRTIMESDSCVTIVTIGPMTNLALLLTMYPDSAGKIDSVYSMGGSVSMPGVGNGPAEFNIKADPEAAEIVFSSGIPVTLFPLDVTKLKKIFPETICRWKAKKGIIHDFYSSSVAFMDFRAKRDGYSPAFAFYHDMLPVIGMVRPDMFVFRECTITVELNDCRSRGVTLVDERPGRHRIAVSAASDELFSFAEESILGTYGETP